MDAIEHYGSYGNELDLLEIMGLLTPEEQEHDSVLGCLSAKDVLKELSGTGRRQIMTELNPCPFCGGEAHLCSSEICETLDVVVECMDCHAGTAFLATEK